MRTLAVFIYLYCLVVSTFGLFEDQVGKFEWRQQYVGKAIYSQIDIISPIKKVIVATDKNVLAALSLKSGDILWRHVFEQSADGRIMFLHVDNEIVTVSGSRVPVVRGWDLETGHALYEWSIGPIPASNHPKFAVVKDCLVVLQFLNSEVVAQWMNLRTGSIVGSARSSVDLTDPSLCVELARHMVCLEAGMLTSITFDEAGQLELKNMDITIDISDKAVRRLTAVSGPLSLVTISNSEQSYVVQISPELKALPLSVSAKSLVSSAPTDHQPLIVATEVAKSTLNVRTYKLDGEEVVSLRSNAGYPANTADPIAVTAVCQQRRDSSTACRLLLSTADHSLSLVQHPGSFLWTREEALASVLSVEVVDLPVSETDAAIEKEFRDQNHGFFGMVARRLMSQWLQLQTLLLTVLGLVSDSNRPSSSSSPGLVRDEFGLHKLIIAVTQPGKVFGIDNLTGDLVWQILADMGPLAVSGAGGSGFPIFPMRSPIHVQHPAQLAVIGRAQSGDGVLLVFNPITGILTEPLVQLGYKVRQATSLQATTDDFIRGILLLDTQQRVHVYPSAAKHVALESARNTYLYTVEPNTGQMDGFALRVADGGLMAVRTWQQKLGQDDAHVVAVVPKRNGECVHSQGRVMGDRSVLYKYANPNLVAIFTQGYHPAHKTILNVFLIDAVSGMIVFSASHRRARDPIQAVHSENWLVYSFVSEKHRRTEVATLELYEGPVQSNATAFSSLAGPPLIPIVERQAYILPAHVIALKDTVTVRGITTKHIMVALSSGGVLELPWAYLDPRRTMLVTQEMREEGVVPYMPELPIPFEAIVNHNQSVAAVRGLHTAPSGIESTSLLVVYGLDVLYTRVAPSKTFDLLKEDFDYFLITAVLSALIIASVITRRMASRKALKQAWK